MGKVAEAPALAWIRGMLVRWCARRSCRQMTRLSKITDLLEGLVVLLVVRLRHDEGS